MNDRHRAGFLSQLAMDVGDLQLVRAIAEDGTVTGAGTTLHLTQSALSHRLKDLEARLGISLFLRRPGRMVMTSAGERLLASARLVLGELNRAQQELSESKNGLTGSIRVSTGCYTCYRWLPAIMGCFRAKFPRVEVRIDEGSTCQAIQSLLAGRIDIAVVSDVPEGGIFRSTPLFDDELVFVLSPKHRLAIRRFLRAADLVEETVIVYPPRETSTLMKRVLTPAGIRPAGIVELPLTEAILEMAASGLGIGFVAEWAAKPYLELRRVIARRLARRGYRRTWSAVLLANQHLPPYFHAFIEMMRQTPRFARVGRKHTP
jgi:LysR family transcriptional regulator, regulator for metE and metH